MTKGTWGIQHRGATGYEIYNSTIKLGGKKNLDRCNTLGAMGQELNFYT